MSPSGKKRAKPVGKRVPKKTFFAVPKPLVQYSSGFPKQLAITHRYAQTTRLTFLGPSSNVVSSAFYTNGLYDPYVALGGLQPLYFDQLSAIYNHYTVMKSRIKVTIIPNTVDGFVGGILIDDDGSPAVTFLDTMMEQPSAVSLVSQRDVNAMVLYKRWDCKSVFGPNPLDNDSLEGDATRNPNETQAWVIYMRPQETTVPNMIFDCTFEIEYDTIWHELKLITGS